MKRITFLMTGLLVLMLACDNPVNNVPEDEPDVFRELVDAGIRVAAGNVNAHVYGSFSITFEGQPGVILSGPANFPGNPKNAGECVNGLWFNPKGKPTSGSIEKPHPHCVGTGSESISVILEPISVYWGNKGNSDNMYIQFTRDFDNDEDEEESEVKLAGQGKHTRGSGILLAHAIDASTLGTTNKHVGTLEINLFQYHKNEENYFYGVTEEDDDPGCTIETNPDVFSPCLNLVIEANYEPLAIDGVGTSTPNVVGFLYWTDANKPFNYTE